ATTFAAGCTLSNQEAPPLAGPSRFGLSIRVSAAPQILPRDGSSMSTISIAAFNAHGSPKARQRLALSKTAGTLSVNEVLTGSNGTATVVYTAPAMNESVSTVTITATPVEGGDINNTNPGSVRIAVSGPDVPVADFTPAAGATFALLEMVTFNASATKLGNVACQSTCTYTWDFGDGSNGKEM